MKNITEHELIMADGSASKGQSIKNKILKAHMDYMKGFELSELVDQIENNLLAGLEIEKKGVTSFSIVNR